MVFPSFGATGSNQGGAAGDSYYHHLRAAIQVREGWDAGGAGGGRLGGLCRDRDLQGPSLRPLQSDAPGKD